MTTFDQILHYMRKSMGFIQPVNNQMFDSLTPKYFVVELLRSNLCCMQSVHITTDVVSSDPSEGEESI
jgi:hypothetical protein